MKCATTGRHNFGRNCRYLRPYTVEYSPGKFHRITADERLMRLHEVLVTIESGVGARQEDLHPGAERPRAHLTKLEADEA